MPSGHFLSQPRFVVLDCQQIPLYKGFVGVIQIVYVFKQVLYVQVPVTSEVRNQFHFNMCQTAVSLTVEIYQAENLELRSWRSEYHEACS